MVLRSMTVFTKRYKNVSPDMRCRLVKLFFTYRTFSTTDRAQQVEVTAKMKVEGAGAAASAYQRVHGFVGRIVDHGYALLLFADGYPIQNFDGRGAD
jgi:hypothetical protein